MMRKSRRPAIARTLGLGSALFTLVACIHTELVRAETPAAADTAAQPPQNAKPPTSSPEQRDAAVGLQNVLEDIAKRLGPAVVHVSAEITAPTRRPRPNDGAIPGPQIFPFGPGGPGFPGTPDPGIPRRRGASGSGVIVSPDGVIVTNRHVVEGAKTVTITLSDHRIFLGTPYTDPNVDLAVVKIDAKDLPYAELGTSKDLHIGQWAVAIGYPFDVGETMSLGIISALGRSQEIESHYYPDLIQTDASINPGNSGGPLIDIHGNVIGINTAIAGEAAQSAGIGFAIPADTVKLVYPQLAGATHKITNYPPGWRRGKLGVEARTIPPGLAKDLGVDQGALVSSVVPDSPAAHAGVEAGDVIVSVNGTPVRDSQELVDVVSAVGPGQKAVLDVVRDQKHMEKTLITGSFDEAASTVETGMEHHLGISVTTLTPDVRKELKLPPAIKDGAIVTAVVAGSPADQAQFQQNDIILRVKDVDIHSADDFNTAIGHAKPGDSVGIKVFRGQTTDYLVLQMPDETP